MEIGEPVAFSLPQRAVQTNERPKPAASLTNIQDCQAAVLVEAAKQGAPFCEVCKQKSTTSKKSAKNDVDT